MKTFRQLRGQSVPESDGLYGGSVRLSSDGLCVVATHPALGPVSHDDCGDTYIKMAWLGDSGDILPCIVRQGYQLFVKP